MTELNSSFSIHTRQNLWNSWIPNISLRQYYNNTLMNINEIEQVSEIQSEEPPSWINKINYWIPFFSSQASKSTIVDDTATYSQLSKKQIQSLEQEATKFISRGNDTWCWFEDLSELKITNNSSDTTSGYLSVFNTRSQKCPLFMNKYPINSEAINSIYFRNSVLLPGYLPEEYFHHLPWTTKLSIAIKNHYNFPSEKHLYLKKNMEKVLIDKKVLIISIIGSLPDKYEKIALGNQCTPRYLSQKIGYVINEEFPNSTKSLSIISPLDQKELTMCLEECVELLKNWKHLFQEADAIFVVGIYHSIPLEIRLLHELLTNTSTFQIRKNIYIGLLGFQSCLKGYQFWDHSSDYAFTEQKDLNFQLNKEKQLFTGCSKLQIEILSKLKNYRKLSSEESRSLKKSWDWLLFNYKGFKVTLVSTLHDNFMTFSQKLAIDYIHPKIQRHIWCDGCHLNMDIMTLISQFLPNEIIKEVKFNCKIPIPKERKFEISIINTLLVAINLGHQQFIPIFKAISPFFISRSFNEYTVPGTLKKQQQNELRSWLYACDPKWKNIEIQQNISIPKDVDDLKQFSEYIYYKSIKDSNDISIKDTIYDDYSIFKSFLKNTINTTLLVEEKHLLLSSISSTPTSIFNNINQYDLVWRFHECLSSFKNLKNLPQQQHEPSLNFSIFLDYHPQYCNNISRFQKSNVESLNRIREMWHNYKTWDPPTKGLKQLKQILSVLSLYKSSCDLEDDVNRL